MSKLTLDAVIIRVLDVLFIPAYILAILFNYLVLVPCYHFKYRHQNAIKCTKFNIMGVMKAQNPHRVPSHDYMLVRENEQLTRFKKFAIDSNTVEISFREVTFLDEENLKTTLFTWCFTNHDFLHEFAWKTRYDEIDFNRVAVGMTFYFQDADKAIMFKLLFGEQ